MIIKHVFKCVYILFSNVEVRFCVVVSVYIHYMYICIVCYNCISNISKFFIKYLGHGPRKIKSES